MRVPFERCIARVATALCAGMVVTSTGCAPSAATHAQIRASDLRARLTIIASDSMKGRAAGSIGAQRAQRYIVREIQRLGLKPMGENGTYEQPLRAVVRKVGTSALRDSGTAFTLWKDFLPIPWAWRVADSYEAPVLFGGELGQAPLDSQTIAGAFVIFTSPAGRSVIPRVSPGDPLRFAAAIAVVGLEKFSESRLAPIRRGLDAGLVGDPLQQRAGPASLLITTRVAELLLGHPIAEAKRGDRGKSVKGVTTFTDSIATICCNILGLIEGADPQLRNQFVALGAHLDHLAPAPTGYDHDSLRSANIDAWARRGRVSGSRPTTASTATAERVSPSHRDSIFNGADDDGSGTVALIAIAEQVANSSPRPSRSLLFVWHTGEELGNQGSTWLTTHPPVSLDSIVAQLNLDMIGRGSATDHAGGGPTYLQVIGARRLSRSLGDIIEATNASQANPFRLDYRYDSPADPNKYYCRSDHYEYARFGIPIAFFTTGEHADYHQVTDEAQYIDYRHLASITSFVRDVAMRLSIMPRRPILDSPRPDPREGCRG